MPLPTTTSRSLLDFTAEELGAWMTERGFKATHAPRVLRQLYAGTASAIRPNAKLPTGLDALISSSFAKETASLALRQVAADGTCKLLLRLADARTVESVLMPDFHPKRAAGCISSQVGCAMGCDFCATTQTGFERNLTAGEIAEQFIHLRREASAAGRTLRTIVFMGMGEPMLNLPNIIPAVKRIADPALGALGWRQITISTVGIIPGIDTLRKADLGVNLALSLHAPDDATRADLLPTGRRFEVKEILTAADHYQATSGRITTIQYCLLAGINDTLAQARDLARLLAGRHMHVNLLRYNPTGLSLRGRTYAPSTIEQTEAFLTELRAHGTVAHLRRARGPDIDAACGQLRKRAEADTSAAIPAC